MFVIDALAGKSAEICTSIARAVTVPTGELTRIPTCTCTCITISYYENIQVSLHTHVGLTFCKHMHVRLHSTSNLLCVHYTQASSMAMS